MSEFRLYLRLAVEGMRQNQMRCILNMLGIVVGVGAVCAMLTLGKFLKEKVIESYVNMGIESFLFSGWPNWKISAEERGDFFFLEFEYPAQTEELQVLFPSLQYSTPLIYGASVDIEGPGKKLSEKGQTIGVGSDWTIITGRKVTAGRNFSVVEIDREAAVCLIGSQIEEELFSPREGYEALGSALFIADYETQFSCTIIGVLAPQSAKNAWNSPNVDIVLPYTSFRKIYGREKWQGRIYRLLFRAKEGSDIKELVDGILNYFERKFGRTGFFRADPDDLLISQMNKFLSILTIVLFFLALISLGVGGIGIANMMLVSLSERIREIGLRKAFGATKRSILLQFLSESALICFIAGLIGIALALGAQALAVYFASKVVKDLSFSWPIDYFAIGASFFSIVLVGILSGLIPAMKASRLQVVEALKMD